MFGFFFYLQTFFGAMLSLKLSNNFSFSTKVCVVTREVTLDYMKLNVSVWFSVFGAMNLFWWFFFFTLFPDMLCFRCSYSFAFLFFFYSERYIIFYRFSYVFLKTKKTQLLLNRIKYIYIFYFYFCFFFLKKQTNNQPSSLRNRNRPIFCVCFVTPQ